MAAIIAVAVNSEGRRESSGLAIGPSEAETFWADFLRSLTRRGLRGVRLVISDAHEGLKAAVAKVLNATWQRCRVHSHEVNALAHVAKGQREMVAAAMAHRLRPGKLRGRRHPMAPSRRLLHRERFEKLAELMDQAEHDVLAFMTFPKDHRTKIHSTNPLERLNKEVKRRTHVVGIFPNDDAITRLLALHPARAKRRVGRLPQIHDAGNTGPDQPS